MVCHNILLLSRSNLKFVCIQIFEPYHIYVFLMFKSWYFRSFSIVLIFTISPLTTNRDLTVEVGAICYQSETFAFHSMCLINNNIYFFISWLSQRSSNLFEFVLLLEKNSCINSSLRCRSNSTFVSSSISKRDIFFICGTNALV